MFYCERRDTCTRIGPVEKKLAPRSVLEENAKGNKKEEREKEGGEEQKERVEGGDVEERGQEKQREHFS